jgi:hypothetical protein
MSGVRLKAEALKSHFNRKHANPLIYSYENVLAFVLRLGAQLI